jgi:hypothetical protein
MNKISMYSITGDMYPWQNDAVSSSAQFHLGRFVFSSRTKPKVGLPGGQVRPKADIRKLPGPLITVPHAVASGNEHRGPLDSRAIKCRLRGEEKAGHKVPYPSSLEKYPVSTRYTDGDP